VAPAFEENDKLTTRGVNQFSPMHFASDLKPDNITGTLQPTSPSSSPLSPPSPASSPYSLLGYTLADLAKQKGLSRLAAVCCLLSAGCCLLFADCFLLAAV
jgi:hypothetical protein